MVTTFIRSVGSHTNQVWRFLAQACKVESNARLVELEHPSLKSLAIFFKEGSLSTSTPSSIGRWNWSSPWMSGVCVGRPSNYWAWYWFPETVRQHLYPEGFRGRRWQRVRQSESGWLETLLVCIIGDWWISASVCACWANSRTSVRCCRSARDSLHLRSWLTGAGEWLCHFFSIREPL